MQYEKAEIAGEPILMLLTFLCGFSKLIINLFINLLMDGTEAWENYPV